MTRDVGAVIPARSDSSQGASVPSDVPPVQMAPNEDRVCFRDLGSSCFSDLSECFQSEGAALQAYWKQNWSILLRSFEDPMRF